VERRAILGGNASRLLRSESVSPVTSVGAKPA
jgi:hypothetical protein